MAALVVVPFGGARSPTVARCATTVTTNTGAERQEPIRLPDTLGCFPRNDPPTAQLPFQVPGLFFASAQYGGTDAEHPALGLTVQGIPSNIKRDMVATAINMLPEEFFRASDFHTFNHGGVEYRCANGRMMSGGRQALCIFFDRRFNALIELHGLEPSVADAKRLSEIADEARVALDTL